MLRSPVHPIGQAISFDRATAVRLIRLITTKPATKYAGSPSVPIGSRSASRHNDCGAEEVGCAWSSSYCRSKPDGRLRAQLSHPVALGGISEGDVGSRRDGVRGGAITGAQTMVAYPEPFILRANAVSRAVGELRRCHGVDNVTGTSTQAPAVGRIAQAPSGPGRAMPAKIEGRLHGDWGGLRSSSARDPVAASTGAPLEREPWRCHSIGRGTHGEPPVGGETARLSPPIIRSRFGCQGVGPDAGPERPAWKTV